MKTKNIAIWSLRTFSLLIFLYGLSGELVCLLSAATEYLRSRQFYPLICLSGGLLLMICSRLLISRLSGSADRKLYP